MAAVPTGRVNHMGFSLLDVPLPWLTQLVTTHLDKSSKQHLCSACKALRDLSFGQADRVLCQVSRSQLGAVSAARSLQLLARCKEGASAKLALKDDDRQPDTSSFTTWLFTLCLRASIAPGLPLHHVTCVELQGNVKGDIVPFELAMACPNMTHLARWGRLCHWSNEESAPVACPRLQQLTMHDLTSNLSVQQLQQQLQSLPHLQHLAMDIRKDQDYTEASCFADGIKVLSKQLTFLHFSCTLGKHPVLVEELFSIAWPKLLALRCPTLGLEDTSWQILSQHAPLLRELNVHRIVTPNDGLQYVDCKVQLLTLGSVDLFELAYLPFHGLHALCIGLLVVDGDYKVDEATQKLVTIGNVVSSRPDGMTHIRFDNYRDDPLSLPPLLPLLRLLPQKSIWLSSDVSLSEPWLQLLADLDCHTLALAPHVLTPACFATLLQQLPKLRTLQLVYDDDQRELPDACALAIQVCASCMTASRPITIQLSHKLAEHLGTRWRTQLEACMQACTHHHVTFELIDDPAP